MAKSITIRDMPERTAAELAAPAALTGRSLQEYIRAHLTAYDAWYVALAEPLQVDVATLDKRISRATDPMSISERKGQHFPYRKQGNT